MKCRQFTFHRLCAMLTLPQKGHLTCLWPNFQEADGMVVKCYRQEWCRTSDHVGFSTQTWSFPNNDQVGFCTKSKHRPYQSISSVLSQAATWKNKGSTYPWFVYCQHLFCWFGRFFSIVKWGFCSQPETQTLTERNWKFRWSTSSQSNSWNAAKNRNNKVKPEVRTVSSMCHSNAAQCESGGPSWAVHVMLSLRTRTRYCQASLAVGHSWEKFRGSKTSTADPPLPKTHTHTHTYTHNTALSKDPLCAVVFSGKILSLFLCGEYTAAIT